MEPQTGRGQDAPDAAWRKSTYSSAQSNCVEIAVHVPGTAGQVAVRDSKDPNGPKLVFTCDEWTGFATRVKSGDFDPA